MSEVMRVMLFRRHKDSGAPVPRADLASVVTKDGDKRYKDKRSLPGYVIALAQRRFLSMLGLEMKALDKTKRSETDVKKKMTAALAAAAGAPDTGARAYVLRSALPAHLRASYVDREADAALRGLTMVVLSLVAIAGEGGIAEDTLWSQLGSLSFARSVKGHAALGDADAALESLVKMRYVQRNKAAGPDGERKMVELAENGLDEPGAARISAFIADTMKARVGAAGRRGESDDEDDD